MKALKHTALVAALLATAGINLAHAASSNGIPGQRDIYTDGAHSTGPRDPYTDGSKAARDAYTDGAHAMGRRDPYTDGGNC
ncbi:hypothetical protein PP715_21165 [Ralstonia solanacearum]|uniref:Uncharacterized protein n=3 Tax=Ralstonia solanacearum TaxID=305 RepID=A0A5H2Q442_RALSL|nr:hypothetical protein [Ralstonia solanacearum]AMP72493.1 hypothetical protein UW163_21975 [Ralstonia solanacearum]AMP76598.1 hypothetical protein RALBFv3_20835 [Ralstonia solanacearum]AYB62506.1 hypothetical protein C2124_18320 [Ralstonia solanacearum]MBB6589290.1 hypothetical protein [Ralstonia solanacearum]MCG3577240.1 hypothetical protein [Ralstonia solanacearum]